MTHVPRELHRIWPHSRTATLACLVAVVLPGVALLGYAPGLRALARVFPAGSVMAPGTAVALIVTGVGLWLVAPPSTRPGRRRAGQALGVIVALYGAAVLAEYLAGYNVAIE